MTPAGARKPPAHAVPLEPFGALAMSRGGRSQRYGLRVRRSATARPGDKERVQAVKRAYAEICRDDVVVELELADGAVSSASRGRPGRPPRLSISRQAVDAGPAALLGDVAHEYAHLLDPHHWRDTALQVVGWTALMLAAIVAVMVYPLIAEPGTPVQAVLAVWLAGWPILLSAFCWKAHFSYQIELRADRTAADLLGDVTPMLVMVDRLAGVRAGYGRMQRLLARSSHPDPARRRRALTAHHAVLAYDA